MEFNGLFNGTDRVKEEPTYVSLGKNDCEMINEKPDLKNVQLLPFPQENPNHDFRKSEECRKSERNDEVEIVVECEDVKPYIKSLSVQKNNVSESHLQYMKYCNDNKTKNIIKIEAVKEEIFYDVPEESNLNFDCDRVKQNKKRRITRECDNEHNLKAGVSAVHNYTAGHPCEICGKKFSTKQDLEVHVNGKHNGISHKCNICGNTFTFKCNLRVHIDRVHNGTMYTCNECGKTLSRKNYLQSHIDAVHNGVKHGCNICEKSYIFKGHLKNHIDTAHKGINYPCDSCGKKFSRRSSLNQHTNAIHNGITHACDVCGKKSSTKSNLKKHVDRMHRSRIPA